MASSSSVAKTAKPDAGDAVRLAQELIATAKVRSADERFWFPHGVDQLELSVSITRDGATVSIALAGPKPADPTNPAE